MPQNVRLVSVRTIQGRGGILFPGSEFECSQAEAERLIAKGVAREAEHEGANPSPKSRPAEAGKAAAEEASPRGQKEKR